VAPESDDNPWHYKFSWAPANVLRAGYDGALYLENNQLKYIPYHRLFQEIKQIKGGEGKEVFEGYYNRDSSRYIPIYGLEKAKTFIRGTLRSQGFCEAWNYLVQTGITSDRISMDMSQFRNWEEFRQVFKAPQPANPSVEKVLDWTFTNEPFSVPATPLPPVAALQILLEKKLQMKPADKDRVVMIHEFEYQLNGNKHKLTSWMDLIGEDSTHTAMAKTVGLPLALAACQIADGGFGVTGVMLPVIPEIYEPLLSQLSEHGIGFEEKEEEV
jgi:saccharopine dehydrogenase (NADP+, L-glutamate forming)